MDIKIPTFIHFPRSGGTYVYNSNKIAFRFFLEKLCLYSSNFSTSNDFRFIYRDGKELPFREINIKKNYKNILTIFFIQKTFDSFVEKYKLEFSGDFIYNLDYKDKRIKGIIKDIDIFSAIVQPWGVRYLNNNFFEEIFDNKLSFKFYLPIREPIERLKSLFFYLKSKNSAHEDSHGIYKSETFEEFIIDEAPDNWITRQLSGSFEKENLNLNDLNEAIKNLKEKEVLIFNVKDIDKMLNFAFKKYGFSFIKDIPDSLKNFLVKFNNNNKNEWNHQYRVLDVEFEKKYNEKLNQITKYEQEIFKLAILK